MNSFSVPLGRTRRIAASPVGAASEPEPITGNVTYVSSDITIATVTPNAGVGGQVQVDVKAIAAGTATITATAQDAESVPVNFSDQFEVVVSSPAVDFVFTDLGLVG